METHHQRHQKFLNLKTRYRDVTTVNRASCLDVGTDSLTCKTRRISYKLDLLELNLDNVISGVGDCASCGS